MKDPKYEKKEDILRALKVISALCDMYEFTYEATAEFTAWDYIIRKMGELFALAEVKCRDNDMRKFPDYTVSFNKIQRIRQNARLVGTRPFMIVRWHDCVGTFDLNKIRGTNVNLGGRHDRPESNTAIENMCHIDFNEITVHDIVIPWDVGPKKKRKSCDCLHRDMWICGAEKMINHKSKEVTCSCKCHTKR